MELNAISSLFFTRFILLFFAMVMTSSMTFAAAPDPLSGVVFSSEQTKAIWLNEKLEVVDKKGHTVVLTMADMLKLPLKTINTGTPWITGKSRFVGPLLSDVLKYAKASEGTSVHAIALNEYEIEFPLHDLSINPAIVAIMTNNKPMTLRQKGPFWIMYNFDELPRLKNESFFSRCIWQLAKISIQ